MNTFVRITGLGALMALSFIGVAQAYVDYKPVDKPGQEGFTQAYFDKVILIPAVKVIQEDAHNRLALLTRQRAFLTTKMRELEPEAKASFAKEQELLSKNEQLERELASQKNRWLSWNAQSQLETALKENAVELDEVQKALEPYIELKNVQRDLDRTMGLVNKNLNDPVTYLVSVLRDNTSNKYFYHWSHSVSERLLPEHERIFEEIAQKIKETPDDEFLLATLDRRHPLAYGAHAVTRRLVLSMLAKEAADLEEMVKKENDWGVRERFAKAAQTYVDNLFADPETADNRIQRLMRSSPMFSPMESSLSAGWKARLSAAWQAIKNAFMPSTTTTSNQPYMQQPRSMSQRYNTFLETHVHPRFERYVQPRLEQLERRVQQSPTLRHLPEISMERLESHGFGNPFQ